MIGKWTFALAVTVGLALALAAMPGFAQAIKDAVPLNVKLGLWEVTTVVHASGSPPMDTSGMTPEQRARIEAALEASRQRAATPHTTRTCMTKEKLAKMPFQQNRDQSCTHTVIESSGTMYAVKFHCAGQRGAASSGEWRMQAATPELVKGNGEITVENAGQKMVSTSAVTAKWVGDSCGDVK